MKKNFLIILFLISLVTLAGCSTGNQQNRIQENNQQDDLSTNEEKPKMKWDENFLEAKLDDLSIGQNVLVMGVKNDDGSITAERIMIGNMETKFDELAPIPIMGQDGEENKDIPANSNRQAPGNLPDFQNMSDEERAKLREQMMARIGEGQRLEGSGNFRRGSVGQEILRIIGEVIKKDEQGLTIKLAEGGSNLIFFSDSTAVFKIK